MPKSWLYGAVLAIFLGTAAFGQQAQAPQPQQAPRNLPQVQCKLNETALGLAAGSWAATLDIAQDQEAEIARLKAEIAALKAQAQPPSAGFERPVEGPPGN